jgi:hypothetical protein
MWHAKPIAINRALHSLPNTPGPADNKLQISGAPLLVLSCPTVSEGDCMQTGNYSWRVSQHSRTRKHSTNNTSLYSAPQRPCSSSQQHIQSMDSVVDWNTSWRCKMSRRGHDSLFLSRVARSATDTQRATSSERAPGTTHNSPCAVQQYIIIFNATNRRSLRRAALRRRASGRSARPHAPRAACRAVHPSRSDITVRADKSEP